MPRVTVITPNYNHARFLPRRLDSILAQTFRDFELIILDNASTDNSREVITAYLHDPRVRAIFNKRNNGSPFKQWNLGLRHATGDYVWIAESDDYAEPTLLETLVDRLERHPNVGMAMCQSWIIDAEERISFDYPGFIRFYRINEPCDVSRWNEDFVADGRECCLAYLYPFNAFANASAVVFRRSALEAVKGAPENMRMCGDWLTYVNVLLNSDFAFVSAHLNYFRRHPATSTVRTPREITLNEVRTIQRRVNDYFGLGERDRFFLELLPHEVGRMINRERQPPHNKVPPLKSLKLLLRFSRLHPQAFGLALRMLGKEQVADLARRVGLLRYVRGLRQAAGSRD
jgi:glycosyltransferase involved in cell wall biosynthesis